MLSTKNSQTKNMKIDSQKKFAINTTTLGTSGLLIALISLISYKTTPYMTLASMSYALLLIGVLNHKHLKTHASLMSAGVILDIALVLILEFKRSAIATSISGKLNPLQISHIIFSLAAVLCYFPTIFLSIYALYSGNKKFNLHRRFGKIAFIFRSIGFLFMFSLLEHVLKK